MNQAGWRKAIYQQRMYQGTREHIGQITREHIGQNPKFWPGPEKASGSIGELPGRSRAAP